MAYIMGRRFRGWAAIGVGCFLASACGPDGAPGPLGQISDEDNLHGQADSAPGSRGTGSTKQTVREQLQALSNEKRSWTPEQQKLNPSLLFAAKQLRGEAFPRIGSPVAAFDPTNNTVTVDIKAEVSNALLHRIRRLGGSVVSSFPQYDAIQARMPVDRLEELAASKAVLNIAPAGGATTNVTSSGDVAHRADVIRALHGLDGTGITIGVMSDGVDQLAAVQALGELPAVDVLDPGPGGSEGTAMLEIVHDLAPGAELKFASAFWSEASFAANIVALRAAGCDIIVDDVFFYAEGAFQDDIIAQAVQQVTEDGALFFSSAGNSGNLFVDPDDNGHPLFASGVYEGDYVPGAVPTILSGDASNEDAHDFGGGNVYNTVTWDTASRFTMQWSDPLGGSDNDYDLYVISPDKTAIVQSSFASQNGTQDPYEAILSPDDHTGHHLVVVRWSGWPKGVPEARHIRLNANRGRFSVGTNGQITGHSAVVNAFSLAAVGGPWFFGTPTPATAFGASTNIEAFTSDGPRRMFFAPDGAPLGGGFLAADGVVRPKPDFAAADGGATATVGFETFYGTSASAPHAAALAALLLEANPYIQTLGNSNATEVVREAFKRDVIDIHDDGFDDVSGHGIMMADSATAFDYCTNLELIVTPPGPQPVGTELTLEASSVGCSAPRYAFRYKQQGVPGWTLVENFAASSSAAFPTLGLDAGQYSFRAYAKQAGSIGYQSVATQGPTRLLELCDAVTLNVDPPTAQPVGSVFTATATASACTNAVYRFDYKKTGVPGWSSLGAWSTNNTIDLDSAELEPGLYRILVRAREAGTSVIVRSEQFFEILSED